MERVTIVKGYDLKGQSSQKVKQLNKDIQMKKVVKSKRVLESNWKGIKMDRIVKSNQIEHVTI